jgi:acyl carrier protein
MEIQEFIKNFSEIFEDIDTSNFSSNTDFRNNDEWSSLTVMVLIAMIDEKYNVQLKGEELKKAKSIQDLFELVESKMKDV